MSLVRVTVSLGGVMCFLLNDCTWTLRLADGARRLLCRRLNVLWPMGRHSSCHSWTEAPETDSTVTLPERLLEGMRTTVALRRTSRPQSPEDFMKYRCLVTCPRGITGAY